MTDASAVAAKRALLFDMQALAEANGSVISATLFGALAGAGRAAVPPRQFRGGDPGGRQGRRGQPARVRRRVRPVVNDPAPATPAVIAAQVDAVPAATGAPALDRLLDRLRTGFPDAEWPILFAGLKRVTDYQDAAYGGEYLDRMSALLALDRQGRGASARASP